MRSVTSAVLSPALLCTSILVSGLAAQTTPSPALLILSKQAHTLSIVDPTNLKVVAAVLVGNDPHEVIASADGTRAYVSNYGFGAFHTLAVVDLVAQKSLPQIDLGLLGGPHGLAFAGGKLWFTSEVAKSIGRYDPATQKIDLILGNGQNRVHMVWVSPDAKQIVATNVSSGSVSIFNFEPRQMPGPPPGGQPGSGGPATPPPPPPPGTPMPPAMDWNQTIVKVGAGSEGFDLSPDRTTVWVANARDATISVIDLASKQVTQTLNINIPGANRLKFTPDGARVLVSAGPNLVVLDAKTYQVIKRIPIGKGSAGILIDPSGARAFVACGPDNYVAVIDLQSLTITAHIQAGNEPDGMAWATR